GLARRADGPAGAREGARDGGGVLAVAALEQELLDRGRERLLAGGLVRASGAQAEARLDEGQAGVAHEQDVEAVLELEARELREGRGLRRSVRRRRRAGRARLLGRRLLGGGRRRGVHGRTGNDFQDGAPARTGPAPRGERDRAAVDLHQLAEVAPKPGRVADEGDVGAQSLRAVDERLLAVVPSALELDLGTRELLLGRARLPEALEHAVGGGQGLAEVGVGARRDEHAEQVRAAAARVARPVGHVGAGRERQARLLDQLLVERAVLAAAQDGGQRGQGPVVVA